VRRFIRSFFIRRKAQVTVIQDGAQRQFEVWIWRAADHTLTLLRHFPYGLGASSFVKEVAVKAALEIVAAEKQRRQTAYIVKHTTTGNYLAIDDHQGWTSDEADATVRDSRTAAIILAQETMGTDGWEVVQVTR
jgi:hypothetical protein